MENVTITTKDNPYNPFEDWNQWLIYDMQSGYNSLGLVARLAKFSDTNTDEENDMLAEAAIDQIVKYDPLDLYRKVRREPVQN